jgi:preprotein translocase subunit SecF
MTVINQGLNFMKYKYVYFIVSLIVIIPGIFSLTLFGLKPSIDFTGGSLLELEFSNESQLGEELIRSIPYEPISISSVQPTSQNTYLIRSNPLTKDQSIEFQNLIASAAAVMSSSDSAQVATATASLIGIVEEIQFATIGPTLGQELLRKTLISIGLAAAAILFYIAYRFSQIKYGVTAIIAMLHDTLILLGIFSLLGHLYGIEVDTLFVTAILTTLSFSVHDTIVVYDRIRESRKQYPRAVFTGLINKAVNETLARSINNSMTIIFMLLSLWLMGGESIKWFVFALLIGTVAGTYSSTFTAAPLLDLWTAIAERRGKLK